MILETDDGPCAHDVAVELGRLMVEGANEFLPDALEQEEQTRLQERAAGAVGGLAALARVDSSPTGGETSFEEQSYDFVDARFDARQLGDALLFGEHFLVDALGDARSQHDVECLGHCAAP